LKQLEILKEDLVKKGERIEELIKINENLKLENENIDDSIKK